MKPRVTLSEVSGIGTLLSGNYIRFEPGKSKRIGREFVGLEIPPSVTPGLLGREFVLRSDTLGSLGVGSPVYYRRLNVGQVISYGLAKDGKSVDIRIFINAPFDQFVTPNTRFWEASGIDVSVGANGLSVQTESLLSLLVGGIAFETPSSPARNNSVTDNAVFPLSNDRATALSPHEVDADRFALYFSGSLRGLSVGAPVDFLGLPVGEVTEVFLDFIPGSQTIRTRVEIATYQHRFLASIEKQGVVAEKRIPVKEMRDFMQRQVVEKGLRAQLRSASLISGQLYVALDYFPDAPEARIRWERKPPEFPVVPSEMANVQASLKSLLVKLDKVPMEEIGDDARKAIAALDRTLATPRRGNPSRSQEDARDARPDVAKREPHAGTRRRGDRSGSEENPRGTAAGDRVRRPRAGKHGQHLLGSGRSGAAGFAGRDKGNRSRRQSSTRAGRLSREKPRRAHSRQDPGETLMRNRTASAVLCILASLWAGCASPRSYFYTLGPVTNANSVTADYSVAVGPVSVPEIVDRPQIVVRTGPNQVFIDEFHRWGSSLRDEIARSVARNLAALLGTPRVSVFPQSTSSGAKYRVAVDVMVFDSTPGEAAALDAVWGIRGAGGGAVRSGRTTVRETVHGDGYAALVAAHSRALEKLSGEIADAIRGLERDRPQ